MSKLPQVGMRVVTVTEVERFPHFIAAKGLIGTVVRAVENLVAVRLDDPLEGAEEWNNELHFYQVWEFWESCQKWEDDV